MKDRDLHDNWIRVAALLTRTLEFDACRLRPHLIRTIPLLILLPMLLTVQGSGRFSAPGRWLFTLIAQCNVVLVTIAGIVVFARIIAEERESRTLGLLMMSGTSNLAILLGKALPRAVQLSLFVLLQFPFILLAVTMGGVMTSQIVSGYVCILAWAFFVSTVALAFSVVTSKPSEAGTGAVIILLIVLLGPALGLFLLEGGVELRWWARSSSVMEWC